jgi:cell division protein FtsI/penicillin-binding protein 2
VRGLYILFLSFILVPPFEAADEPLQRAVNEAIGKRQGAAVALDVETGRILASYRMDVAARRIAPPGSTVKPFTLMALLDAGLVTDKTTLICPLTTRIGGRTLDCSHPAGLGPIDPVMALAYSCNHFFIRNSEHLPMDSLYRAFSRIGFNSLTGKWRSEIPGTLQQPASKEAMQLMSIGEDSVGVTPLALAEAYRMLAKGLRNPKQTTPELRLVAEGLESAVKVGTAQLAASRAMRVAGKTGTAGGHAWFAGFAPVDHPEIVVVVFLERGRGGSDAAPIAGRIFAGYSLSAAGQ